MRTNEGLYEGKETIGHLFLHSCLGQLIIAGGIIGLLLLIARLTIPTDETINTRMTDSILRCIEENTRNKSDGIDDAVRNITDIFATTTETEDTLGVMDDFNKYNKLTIHHHTFYSTARLDNNRDMKGTRIGIGIFGMVIPTISYNDMILQVGPIHKEYNQPIIKNAYEGEDLGNNPDFGNSYNTYQGGGSGE